MIYSRDDVKRMLEVFKELVVKIREDAADGYAVPEDIADDLENKIKWVEGTL